MFDVSLAHKPGCRLHNHVICDMCIDVYISAGVQYRQIDYDQLYFFLVNTNRARVNTADCNTGQNTALESIGQVPVNKDPLYGRILELDVMERCVAEQCICCLQYKQQHIMSLCRHRQLDHVLSC